MIHTTRLGLVFICAIAVGLAGCNGSGGDDGGSESAAPEGNSYSSAHSGGDPAGGSTDNSSTSSEDNSDDSAGEATDVSSGSGEGNGDDSADGTIHDSTASSGSSSESNTRPTPRRVVGLKVFGNSKRAQNDVPLTFGQVFARGDVPAGRTLVAEVDGKSIATQVDKKATWADGSLRHAVITARLTDLPAGAKRSIELDAVKDSKSPGAVTLNQLLATSFDATARFDIKGRSYTASARKALRAIQQSGRCPAWGDKACKRWLKGPLVSEWVVAATPSAGRDAATHLRVYFDVRAYAGAGGGIGNVRVDTVIENDLAYVSGPHNVVYDLKLNVGDNSYAVSNLTHYRQARWHRVLWWHDDPGVYAKLDTDYLQASKAISKYADLTPPARFLASRPDHFKPMTNGNQTAYMPQTGAQAGIGPLPRWTSTYVVSGDHRAYQWMLANDDAVGAYSFHYRDGQTGRPLKITDHPYVTIANIKYARKAGKDHYQRDLLPKCESACSSPYTFNIAHHPSIGYVPYLVTGDYYYLEEMQFTASYDELYAHPRYRDYAKGRLRGAQGPVRGQAWALRSISDAAFATPDADPMKSYFQGLMKNILADYNAYFVDHPDKHPLHVFDNDGAVIYPKHGQKRVGIAPWQQHFMTWAAGHAAEQGVPGARRLLKWLAVFPVAAMTNWIAEPDTGYCWLLAAAYKLQIRPTRDGDIYPNLDAAYKANFPGLYGVRCDSQQYSHILSMNSGKTYKQGQMSGYAHSATGYPANLQIALAMAADSGIKNAKKAWRIFSNRSVQPYPDRGGKGSPNYSTYPNFAVVPRN